MKFTIRQLLRAPVRQILFMLLMALCAAVFSLGYGLYVKNVRELEEMDSHFITMGTFEQLPTSTEWVAEPMYASQMAYDLGRVFSITGDAIVNEYESAFYAKSITLEDIAALPYKIPTEYRPTYLAKVFRTRDGVQIEYDRGRYIYSGIYQIAPDDTFTLEEGGEIHIRRDPMFGRPYGPRGMVNEKGFPSYLFWFDRTPPPAEKLNKGTEYIVVIRDNEFTVPVQRFHAKSPYSGEYETVIDGPLELTEDFFETEQGDMLEELSENLSLLDSFVFSVVPTQDLNLLMSFYQKNASMVFGEAISEEQFENGERVCMIPQKIADNYALNPGDELELSFVATLYGIAASATPYMPSELTSLYDAPLSVFEQATYRIAGVYYESAEADSAFWEYSLPHNGIIIPANSIQNPDTNVVTTGPMIPYNTSFLVENDKMEEFQRQAETLGLSDGKFTYYDMGYNSIKKGMDQVIALALALFVAGAVSTVLLLVYFLFLQITRHSRESAIQVSLGMSRLCTAASLLLSVMAVIVIGTALGTIAGKYVSEEVGNAVYARAEETSFSTDYSENRIQSAETDYSFSAGTDTSDFVFSGILVVLAGLGLSTMFIFFSLKKEPMMMLTRGGADI